MAAPGGRPWPASTGALRLAEAHGHTLTAVSPTNEIAFLWHEPATTRGGEALPLSCGVRRARQRAASLQRAAPARARRVKQGRLAEGEANSRSALDLAAGDGITGQARPGCCARSAADQHGRLRRGLSRGRAHARARAAADELELAWTERWLGRLALAEGRPDHAALHAGHRVGQVHRRRAHRSPSGNRRCATSARPLPRPADHQGARSPLRRPAAVREAGQPTSVAAVDALISSPGRC